MKSLLIGLMTLSPLVAFSQVADYEMVNQRNADRINSEYSQNRNQFFKLDHTDYPSKEKYSSIEKEQIKLLNCTRDLIQKYKGGYDGPEISQQILLGAMEGNSLSLDKEVLTQATKECREAYKKLFNFKEKAINQGHYRKALNELPRSTEAEIKTAKVISNFSLRQNIACKAVSVGGEVYALWGMGAGINSIKCLQSDARVKKYIGIDLRTGLGVGAAANVTVYGDDNISTGKVAAGFVGDRAGEEPEYYALGLTKLEEADEGFDQSQILNLGIGVNVLRIAAGAGFRVFNGKSKWGKTLNALK